MRVLPPQELYIHSWDSFRIAKWEMGSVHTDRWYSLLFPISFALMHWAHKPERNTELSPEPENATGGTGNTRKSILPWSGCHSVSPYTLWLNNQQSGKNWADRNYSVFSQVNAYSVLMLDWSVWLYFFSVCKSRAEISTR